MAYDLQARFHALRTATSDTTPTSPTTQPLLNRDNGDTGSIRQGQDKGTDVIAHGDLSSNYPALIRSAGPIADWFTFGESGNHASTPPINVPAAASNEDLLSYQIDRPLHQSRYRELSPLETFLQDRRPSVSFHPQVTLESGHHHGLEEPLPKFEIDTGRSSSSTLQELSKPSPRSPLSRAFSHTESISYDPYPRLSYPGQIQSAQPPSTSGSPRNQSRYPLLSSGLFSLPRDKRQTHLERNASLTTASTASSIPSETRTPSDSAMDCLISPISSFSLFPDQESLDDSRTWAMVQRRDSAPRAKSFSFNRRDSVRQSQRQSSRRSTASSMSPATAFLSKFARDDAVAEPDDEGREVGEYVLGRKIGYGGFSVVKEAYTIDGSERVCRAVKIVRKQVIGKEDIENEQFQADFEREVGLWRCLSHRHVLSLIAVHVTDFATYCFTKLSEGGTLFDLVRANRQGLSRDLARRYTYQLASAIRYLHEDMRIVHRDIKLENCLIDLSSPDAAAEGGNLLLCDFGLAEFITEENSQDPPNPYQIAAEESAASNVGGSESSMCIAGSLEYASPELLLSRHGFLSRSVDVWAFGVVVYALLVGNLPFQHAFQPRVQMMILAGEWDHDALRRVARAMETESDVVELVHGCLEMDSANRWTIGHVLDSRWLNGCQEMLEEINESNGSYDVRYPTARR